MAKLALRFISGKYKGGEYLLPEGREIFVGRSSDIDLVLMEDMVSRKHARLWVEADKVNLEDLGSTNGTFVNGEKITKTSIGKGDRVLIGTSIMKVVEADARPRKPRLEDDAASRSSSGVGRVTVHSGGSSMSGTIAEVPLPDLIQLFSTSKKTGTLVVTKEDVVGKIHLDHGRIIYASLSDSDGLAPLKAIFRVLGWDDGTFELLGPEPHDFPDRIDMPTEHILMEGLRHLDEARHMQAKLPPLDAELVVVTPLTARLAELSADELDIFQLVYNFGTVRTVVDRAKAADLEVAQTLATLMKRNYIAQV